MQRYNPKEIEPKWQKIWDETGIYTADLQNDRPKYVAMSMFNYPSGAGIHIGHAMNYTVSDVKARFKRQQGFESYHPVGWDAFGLPAENYAIKSGVSPQESMATIIPGYHKQYKAMGWSNDWEKEIATHLPEYYKWTQWIFAQMFKQGLAYQASRMQWWCPIDNTVLANEQVIDGKCWRHDGPNDPLAEKREVKQWFFKITEYADELLEAIDELDWTESVKLAQKNWIGKSVGAEIEFAIENSDQTIKVFTTRPDTLFGATFLVVAPEHPIVNAITNDDYKQSVAKYKQVAAKKTEVQRQEGKEKTGVFTGAYAINPASGEKIPVWTADYALLGYGTGAIMAVPAHDERDQAFANVFSLPIREVIEPQFGSAKGDEKHKQAIIAIVRDPKTNKVLVLDWGPRRENWGGNLFIGGGIEDGEDPVETAKREIAEETGYANVNHIKTAPTYINNFFFSNVKNQNYHARLLPILFELADDTQVDRQLDDNEDQFTMHWVPEMEIATTIADEAHLHGYHILTEEICYQGEGIMIRSGTYDGLESSEVREKIVADLAMKGAGQEKVNYRMHDWSVSRQRYWGAPIPIIDCPKCGPQLVPDEDLPVLLPELDDFQPSGDGRSALARATDWLSVDCPNCGGKAERETDTLDTYICSSWYFLRYLDPHNQQKAFDGDVANKWMPIDFYNGADHATAHMLYARFVTRFFTKIGLLDNPEPFKQFLFNGKVTAHDGQMFSKSKGNGIDPLEIIDQGYGADALRTYLMFASPLELWTRWDSQGVPGTYRFLSRLWNLVQEYQTAGSMELSDEQQQAIHQSTHQAIKKITEDIEESRYNTAIATAMGCVNDFYKLKTEGFGKHDAWYESLTSLTACVAPFAPHIAEELWHQLGHSTSVHRDTWPKYDEQYLVSDSVTIAVQVNGKVRGQLELPANIEEVAVIAAAEANSNVQTHIAGKEILKTIYVPGKILNLVVR